MMHVLHASLKRLCRTEHYSVHSFVSWMRANPATQPLLPARPCTATKVCECLRPTTWMVLLQRRERGTYHAQLFAHADDRDTAKRFICEVEGKRPLQLQVDQYQIAVGVEVRPTAVSSFGCPAHAAAYASDGFSDQDIHDQRCGMRTREETRGLLAFCGCSSITLAEEALPREWLIAGPSDPCSMQQSPCDEMSRGLHPKRWCLGVSSHHEGGGGGDDGGSGGATAAAAAAPSRHANTLVAWGHWTARHSTVQEATTTATTPRNLVEIRLVDRCGSRLRLSLSPLLARPTGYRHNLPKHFASELARLNDFCNANGLRVQWDRVPFKKSCNGQVRFWAPGGACLGEVTGWDVLSECTDSGQQALCKISTAVAWNHIESWIAWGLLPQPHLRLPAQWLDKGSWMDINHGKPATLQHSLATPCSTHHHPSSTQHHHHPSSSFPTLPAPLPHFQHAPPFIDSPWSLHDTQTARSSSALTPST